MQLLPYIFSYKTEFFFFSKQSQNLDPFYKMDLDVWDCLGRLKVVLQQNFKELIKLFKVILDRGELCLIAT